MSNTEEKQNVQSVGSGPQVNILYSAPGFAVLDPDTIKTMANPSNTIFSWGGVQIVKISPEVAVKFGSHVTLHEAKSMLFVNQNTETVPVPKIFAYYSYGPIDRDIGDYGSYYDNYIFMTYVEGQGLDKLKGYLDELRQIEHRNYIGSVDRGPLPDPILGELEYKEDDFNNAIINAYQDTAPKRHVKNVLVGMLASQKRHNIVFTHGDFRHPNIMVNDGNVTGIVDWEFSGWFPEHWEFVKALAKLHAIVPSHCDHLPIGPSESISKRPARIAPVAPPLLLPPVPSRALTQPLLGATSSFLSANDSPELLPVAVMSLAARLPGLSTQPICFLQSFARSPVVV
ncbi:phosphotransferase enzyme family protein [Aspergillus costaricaensis CBS 115574]|uniref:Phosphotransferase enzyme family protein n=1 Tax=Aspergillus costaricaensis CBS 115574 TaxID=1448317 RepID=A0ACD1HYB8_9EURO|nr:phosphotransferase enzyme family protein [Aspergillus costaricaensis CBS 115574]RAK82938.1 phosphotransferase enzyme family protein [Aspergillus costaricaensis CBS 115574]